MAETERVGCCKVVAAFWAFHSTIILVLTPCLFSLLFVLTEPTPQVKCLYTVLVMATYWITEVLPLAVTAMLPLVFYPLLGVSRADIVAKSFMTDALFLFMGGFFIAIALECSNLHKRLALKTLLLVGADPRKILMALMSTTAFLSMWISNAAATGMMLPIIQAILIEMIKGVRAYEDASKGEQSDVELAKRRSSRTSGHGPHKNSLTMCIPRPLPSSDTLTTASCDQMMALVPKSKDPTPPPPPTVTVNKPAEDEDEIKLTPETLSEEEANLCKMLLLSACYASSIGGVGTLTGTPPNIIIFGYYDKTYGRNTGLTYLSWMVYAVPIVVLNTICAWVILVVFFLGFKMLYKSVPQRGNVHAVIRSQYTALGPMSFQEKAVAILFGVLILLWITHSPQFVKGWADLFQSKFVSGATPAILISCLMFALPAKSPDISTNLFSGVKPVIQKPLMTWKYLQSKFPWDMIILIGGSFAMADGISSSGLSKDVGNYLKRLGYMGKVQLCFVSVALASAATEFTSNAAMATILTPILSAVAVELKMNPLYLALSGAVGVSYAFMLPIGTPANAIVFALGLITVMDMVKVGAFLNIATLLVTVLASNTWGWWLLDFGGFPEWAQGVKSTTSSVYSSTVPFTTMTSSFFNESTPRLV